MKETGLKGKDGHAPKTDVEPLDSEPLDSGGANPAKEPDGLSLHAPEPPGASQGAPARNDSGASPDRLEPAKFEKLLDRLDNSGLREYVKLSGRTWKVLWLNFLSGMARGLGFTVGTAIVLAVVYKILSHIISMNIPYLTELLNELLNNINNINPPVHR